MTMSQNIMRAGAFSFAMLLTAAAEAATLQVMGGNVMVSRGGGPYQLVGQSTELRAGDSVLVNPGAAATVVYANGCALPVQPGMVHTVTEVPPSCDPSLTTGQIPSQAGDPVVGDPNAAGAIAAAIAAGIAGTGLGIAVSDDGGTDVIIIGDGDDDGVGGISP